MERMKKKRQRKDSESDEDMMEDDNIIIDEVPQVRKIDTSDVDMGNDGMIYTDFVFSGLKDNYFHNIKTLIRPLFEFDNVNISGLADMILSLKEDVGSAIKTEDEEETNNPNVDIFGIFSMLPLSYYCNGSRNENELTAVQVLNCLIAKFDKYGNNEEEKLKVKNIIKSSRVGLLINERVINLPQEAIPIVFDFLIKEIGECKEDDAYDQKFEFDYIVIISKFVKKIIFDESNKTKKRKTEVTPNSEEILQYKFETEHFMKKAEISLSYKIPYDQMNLDYLENKNEPQYYSILFLKVEDFLSVIYSLKV